MGQVLQSSLLEASHRVLARQLPMFARAATLTAMGISIAVLAGWQFGLVWLTTVVPHYVTMKPITAMCFLLCGGSLWLQFAAAEEEKGRAHLARKFVANALAGVALACGLATIYEQISGMNLAFEELLFRATLHDTHIVHPGRMSQATALAFVMLGLALLLYESGWLERWWQPLAFLVLLSTFVQVLAYLWGAADLYQTFGQNPMAVHTAGIFIVLSAAMFAGSRRGWLAVLTSPLAGGAMARKMLPTAMLVPVVLAWLRLEGQRAGWYHTEFGLALFTSLNIATFVIVVWFGARSLNASARTLEATNTRLALSEERLRMATTSGGIGVWRWDLATEQMYCSPTCREICGLDESEDLAFEGVRANVHPEDRGYIENAMGRTFLGGDPYAVEYRRIWPDGTVHWIASRGTMFRDEQGKPLRMEGIVQEITERKAAEEQIKRLAAIVEASEDAIISRDLQGNVTSWNAGAERMYGYQAEELLGQPLRQLAIPGREDAAETAFERAREGESTHQLETQRRAKNGKIVEVSLSASPLRDSHGKIVGVSSIARDVTEQHVVQRQLRQAQKMEAIGQLAGGVAHDFNNLVMVINSYAQIIKDEGGSPAEIRGYAEQILGAGQKAASVTRQLLAFGRKQLQDLKVVDLNELVPHFCKLLPHVLGEEIAIEIKTCEKPARLRADQGQVEQVLMNLVVNARDAMPKGGRLCVSVGAAEIGPEYCALHDVSVEPGKYVALSVSDSGSGMDAETKAHIFEPFFTTKEVGKGSGLGLATVYGIVKQHKGLVWVYSEVGVGTEFKLYFPECTETAEKVKAAENNAAPAAGHETILLVEDEQSLREVISQYLSGKGYSVLAAENGAEALRHSADRERRIDVLLTDFIMPGMRGPEVAREVLKTHPEARVIFMSGYADRELNIDELHVRRHFLQKPVNLRDLAAQIRVVLQPEEDEGKEAPSLAKSP